MISEQTATMRAIGVHEFGGPDVLQRLDVPIPRVTAGTVRIQVHAASVVPADLLLRSGALRARLGDKPAPWIPGTEVSGTVDAASNKSRWVDGDIVMAVVVPHDQRRGAYADYVTVPDTAVAALPAGVDLAEAAAVPMSGLTAALVLELADVGPETALAVTGASGVVGGLAIQMARAIGASIVCDGRDAEDDRSGRPGPQGRAFRDAGAARGFRDCCPGGVDVLVDAANGGVANAGAVRDGGTFVALREPGGDVVQAARARGVHVIYERVWDFVNHERMTALGEMLLDGRVEPPAIRTFAPEAAPEAHRTLERGGARARPVLDFSRA